MRFLSPFALFGLSLIALPIAIHLLVRRRAVKMDFPSLRFLRETPSFRLRPRQIQQPILLALRIAAIALLVIGMARPLISVGTRTPRARVILLDASLSMQASGRAEAAKAQARNVIERLNPGERVSIISFTTGTELLSGMTSDKRELSKAVDAYQPASGVAEYANAVSAADRLLQEESAGETLIDLISDFQSNGVMRARLIEDDNRSRSRIIAHPVGARLQRNSFLSGDEVNAGESNSDISASQMIINADERSADRRNWPLDSTDGNRSDIEWRTETNGQVTARIRTLVADDFDADDERYLAFRSPRKGRALLIEQDGDEAAPYLRAALESVSGENSETQYALERKASLPNSLSELRGYSLIALTLHGGPRTDDIRALTAYASAGGTVWLCMGNDIDTAAWNSFASTEDGRPLPFVSIERMHEQDAAIGFGRVDPDASPLRFMNEQVLTTLRTVRMRHGFSVRPRVGSATMVRWKNGTPVFVGTEEKGGGRILLLATSPARMDGDLGISTAFPALAFSIARMSVTPIEPIAYEIGQPVNLKIAPDALAKIDDTRGKTSTTARAHDLITHPDANFSKPGIYRVESDGLIRYLAFNAPELESETALTSTDEIDRVFNRTGVSNDARPGGARISAEREGNAWRYFLLAAFLLLMAELFVTIRQNVVKAGAHTEGRPYGRSSAARRTVGASLRGRPDGD